MIKVHSTRELGKHSVLIMFQNSRWMHEETSLSWFVEFGLAAENERTTLEIHVTR